VAVILGVGPGLGRPSRTIAESYWHLAHQDRSAWTLELEVRPLEEKF
jgi:hypothetical protein